MDAWTNLGPMHGYGIASWIETATDDVLRAAEGSLYPARHRNRIAIMTPGSDFRQRFMRAFRSDPQEEVDDELAFHLERLTRRYTDGGLDPADARRAALERIGDLGPVREECARLLTSERKGEDRRRRWEPTAAAFSRASSLAPAGSYSRA